MAAAPWTSWWTSTGTSSACCATTSAWSPACSTPEQTLTFGHGSCRDFAWLSCQVLRHLGFAARFASGYSIQLKPDEKPVEGPAGVSEDVADLHAWTEVFLPGAGWVGLDATSGLLAGEGHIPLACTPDPGSAAPIAGSFAWDKRSDDDRLDESFSFTMSVTRVAEAPRSTKPYTDEAWARIASVGESSTARWSQETFGSRWVASQPSCLPRIPMLRNGTRPLSENRSFAWPTLWYVGCAIASRLAAWFTTDKASGIRENRSRAGPSLAIFD